MARFIHLTSAQPGIGKIRINIDGIAMYFRRGQQTVLAMLVQGIVETVVETPEELDLLIKQHSGLQLKH